MKRGLLKGNDFVVTMGFEQHALGADFMVVALKAVVGEGLGVFRAGVDCQGGRGRLGGSVLALGRGWRVVRLWIVGLVRLC